eukprot:12196678-Karenia_brevis.AAC.1
MLEGYLNTSRTLQAIKNTVIDEHQKNAFACCQNFLSQLVSLVARTGMYGVVLLVILGCVHHHWKSFV